MEDVYKIIKIMYEIKNQTKTKYAIAHNKKDVFHFLVIETDKEMVTGQPFIEIFDSEEKAGNKLNELFGKIFYPFDKDINKEITIEDKYIQF